MDKETQSIFVTVLAWICIVLSGFSLFISILQNIMVNLVFPLDEMQRIWSEPGAEDIPFFVKFMFSNMRLVVFSFFVLISITFISSIGLLKRKNWARILFIGLMVWGIMFNVLSFFIQGTIFPDFSEVSAEATPMSFKLIFSIMRVFTSIISIGFIILMSWIIKELCSRGVKEEFANDPVIT